MISFIIKNKLIIVSILLLFLLLTLFQKNIKKDPDYNFFDKIIVSIFTPPLQITSSIKKNISSVWEKYFFQVDSFEKIRYLENYIIKLELENQILREKYVENQRLRALLDLKERYSFKMMAAEIIGRDPSTWFKTLMVNRGKKQGVKTEYGIITSKGVVGKIVSVSHSSSKILAITDVNSSLDAVTRRTQTRGIVEGFKGENCKLSYVLKTEDIQTGDEVITSGIHGTFPKGLLIGTVVRVEKDKKGFFQLVEIEPAVEITKTNKVMIILKEENL